MRWRPEPKSFGARSGLWHAPFASVPPPRLLYENEQFRIELRLDGIVILTRSAVPFKSADEIERACVPIQLELNRLGRRGKHLLVDTRLAVGNNDSSFEVAFASHRQRMAQGFARVAIVVQTPLGRLQNQRLAEESRPFERTPASSGTPGSGDLRVFMSFDEALVYLGADLKKDAAPAKPGSTTQNNSRSSLLGPTASQPNSASGARQPAGSLASRLNKPR